MTWTLPTLDLPVSEHARADDEILDMAVRLTDKFGALGVECEVEDISVGPSTVSFLLRAGEKTRMVDFSRLKRADDIAYALGVPGVRIEAPCPGRGLVRVETANPVPRPVYLGDVLQAASAPLTTALGLSERGPVALNVAETPHCLVAGTSGAGKSTLLHSIIASLAMKTNPEQLQLVLGDSKMVELVVWEGLPHLAGRVLTSVGRILDGFEWLVSEMEDRYETISARGFRDIAEYNRVYSLTPLPYVLLVVDELADAMMAARGELESYVVRLGQKGRAAGIHMILATQSPRAQVFTGLLKANCPARIALRTVTALDSRVAIDRNGAEELLGKGDALLDDGQGRFVRFQSPLVERDTIEAIVEAWKVQVPEEVHA